MPETPQPIQREDLRSGDPMTPLSSPPLKTPMYSAMNAERYQRQEKIKKIQIESSRLLLCYVAGNGAPITRDDVIGMMELLHNVPRDSKVDLLLHTGGGEIDAAEKLVSILRASVGSGELRIIIPDFAKSAGTLIALSANKIIMSDSSELGPIDPQYRKRDSDGNERWHSVMNYLKAYDSLYQKLKSEPDNAAAQLMLAKLDPDLEVSFRTIAERARQLAEQHLNRYMFQNKKGNWTKIARELMDTDKWLSHGQMINYGHAKDMGLEVEYLNPDSPEWRSYWSLYCLQRLGVKDGQKLFESDFASVAM